MHKAYDYVIKTAENKDRITTLRTQNAEFLKKKAELCSVLPVATKKSLTEVANSTELRSFTRPTKKLEDLDNIMKIKTKIKDSQTEDEVEIPSRSTPIKKQTIDKYLKTVSKKYFLSCLIKSIGAISEGTYPSKATNLTNCWNILVDLPVDNKLDNLFGLLLYRFSKNLYGKSFKASIPTSHYLGVLENLNGSLSSILSCLHLMSSQKQDPTSFDLLLSRPFVETFKSRLSFLVKKLAENDYVVSNICSPFYTTDSLSSDLLMVYKTQLSSTLIVLRNLMLSLVVSGKGFEKVLKAELKGNIEEGSIESTRKCFSLISVFRKAHNFFKNSLENDEFKAKLEEIVNESIEIFAEKKNNYHKMKILLDKETSRLLQEKLVSSN